MKLSSVRDLKSQLSEDTLPPILESLRVQSFAVGGEPKRGRGGTRRAVRGPRPPVALGVAQGAGAGDYKIAVRIQKAEGIGAQAAAEIPQRIHELARGEADIRVVHDIRKRAQPVPWYQGTVRPLTIGSSVGHYKITAGTIGTFVTCNKTGDVCILSNNHVLASEGNCKKGDAVLQQGKIDLGTLSKNRVAALERWTRFSTRGKYFVDAAVAAVDEEMLYWATKWRGRPEADLAGVRRKMLEPGDDVRKLGRTTGYTHGKVTAIELDDVVVGYDMGDVTFDNQIEIEGVRGTLFCDGGDSGSSIIDSDHKVCALLFAGGYDPDKKADLTYAHPIKAVFDALDVKLAR